MIADLALEGMRETQSMIEAAAGHPRELPRSALDRHGPHQGGCRRHDIRRAGAWAVPDVLIAPEQVADAVVRLATDESLAGRLMVWYGGAPPRLIPFGDQGYAHLDDLG